MFYVLSKTIFVLAMPLTWVFIGIIYAFFAKKLWKKNTALVVVVLYLYAASCPALVNRLMLWWEVPATSYIDISQPYEVGIVLSGTLNNFKSPHDRIHIRTGADRMVQAADLYRRGLVKRFIITGGYQQTDGQVVDEAGDMKKIMVQCQVPDSLISIEPQARNTRENAQFTAEILQKQSVQTPSLLITSAFHMRRSLGCFAKANVAVHPFSVDFYTSDPNASNSYTSFLPGEDALHTFYKLVHEMVGVAVYKIMGYI